LKIFQKIAIGYLVFLAVWSCGVFVGGYQWYPTSLGKEIQDFLAYSDDNTTVVEKLESDLGGNPWRFLHKYPPSYSPTMREMEIPSLRDRRLQPLVHLTANSPEGYRLLFGAFDFEETFWGAVLIDSEGKVVNTWHLSTDELRLNKEPDIRKNMYGVEILPDGSIIFLMQEDGGGIVKVDYCGREVWTIDGEFHHIVSLTEQNEFWTFEGLQTDFDPKLVLFDVKTGRMVRQIDMKEVRAANPHANIFDLQRTKNVELVEHAVHSNDIDPLPQFLKADFPQFMAGDLLVSYHTTNLVFVLDPRTLQIKWWRVGPWDRQHDPDWNAGGFISVFDNNARGVGEYSNIVTIDPQTLKSKILIDGSQYQFYSVINGMHELTSTGTVMVTSSTQGRIFEVNRDGEVVFDFVNRFSPDRTLHVSNARYLGKDFFHFQTPPNCQEI
jgi:hypothetical protein